MPENFQYDVFLSHSSKDKAIVRVFSSGATLCVLRSPAKLKRPIVVRIEPSLG
jgi:hypothetical protein